MTSEYEVDMVRISDEQIFNASANGVIVTDNKGIVLKVNNNALAIFRFDESDLLGHQVFDVLPMTGELISKSLGNLENIRGTLVRDNGVSVVLDVTLILHDGLVTGLVASFKETAVFEKIAKEFEFYKLQNRELKAIFDSVSDGIWVCDGKGLVLDINKASEELNQITKDEVVGQSVYQLVDEGMYDKSSVIIVLEKKEKVTIVQEIKRIKKKVLVTATPVFDEDGEISLVVVNARDMTQLNNMKKLLEASKQESDKLKETLSEINLYEVNRKGVIGGSESFSAVLRVASKLAQMEVSNILLLGESGTGKGLLAKYIHKCSNRRDRSFIQINCAALPDNLLEAELFGYEEGAFTGAKAGGKVGLIELSHGGTLFLDEIGELPLSLQGKLLKYFDDHEVMRLGGIETKKVDCTIIAATNRDLEHLIRKKRFRRDLYYRINTFTLKVPPLRKRSEDVFDLVNYYLDSYNKKFGTEKKISLAAFEVLQNYRFPGNVRELKSIIKKGVVLSDSNYLDDFIVNGTSVFGKDSKVGNFEGSMIVDLKSMMCAHEKRILQKALDNSGTTREIASKLKIDHSTVVRKLKKHNLAANSDTKNQKI
jgi:PAS domain S-box-containing protein